jgi:hypothetical protein
MTNSSAFTYRKYKPEAVQRKPAAHVCLSLLVIMSVATAGCGGPLLQVIRAKPPAPPSNTLEECLSAKKHPCELPGVPFYVVGYRCLHSTVWLQPVYSVTVVVTSSDGKYIPPVMRFFGRKEFDDPKIKTVLEGIKAVSQSPRDEYQSVLDVFTKLDGINPLEFDTTKILVPGSKEEKEVLLVSNSVVPERYVAANAVFYYNVKKPWNGTANAEIDLSSEGILNKVSGQVEDKTLATILSALPISDLIKAGAGLKAAGFDLTTTTPAPAGKYKLDLQIQTRIYKHTRSASVAGATPPCSPETSLVGADGTTPFNFTVEDVTAPPTPPAPKPPSDTQKPQPSSPPPR